MHDKQVCTTNYFVPQTGLRGRLLRTAKLFVTQTTLRRKVVCVADYFVPQRGDTLRTPGVCRGPKGAFAIFYFKEKGSGSGSVRETVPHALGGIKCLQRSGRLRVEEFLDQGPPAGVPRMAVEFAMRDGG